MIDTHSHILPYMDDGSGSIVQSVNMAVTASSEGIRAIIATPHHANGHYDNEKNKVMASVKIINNELKRIHFPVTIVPGQEIRVYRDLLDDYAQGEVMTLNEGNYMLLELPYDAIPPYMFDLIYELKLMNIHPVIAHPERNREIVKNPDLFAQLVKSGVLGQITAPSVLGHFGRKVRDVSIHLCKNKMVHLLASDNHGIEQRPCSLRLAYEQLSHKIGIEAANDLKHNAELLLNNEPIRVSDPLLKTRFWRMKLRLAMRKTGKVSQ